MNSQNLQLKFSVAGQGSQTVSLKNPPLIIGTLLSNQVVLRAAGVEPIHALIEEDESRVTVTDLGSVSGVFLNGKKIEVQSPIRAGDKIQIGSVVIEIEEAPSIPMPVASDASLPKPPGPVAPAMVTPSRQVTIEKEAKPTFAAPAERTDRSNDVVKKTVTSSERSESSDERRKEKKDLLFSPRKARPSGDVLEVVAYWDDTVLDVDLFHPSFKNYNRVTIGDPTKAHFIAAGDADISSHVLATVEAGNYKIRLLEGMEARMRKGGQVESASGPSSHRMGPRDIAHIKYGSVRYFLLFVRPPTIDMPRSGVRDPVMSMLTFVAALFYLAVIPALWLATPRDIEKEKDDIWALVQTPKKEEKPKPQPVPKPVVKIEEVKKEPPVKRPPPPEPKPVKAAKPIEVDKPKQTKPVEAPKEEKQPEKDATANLKTQEKQPVKPATPQQSKASGMASTDSTKPDFKKAGAASTNPDPKSGGAKGSGNNQMGGARKGKESASNMGVEGPKNNQASGVNLSKLGLGVGKILNQTGPGAINTPFKNSAGGAGGGSGSAGRTYGFGGLGNSASLGLAGSGGAVNNFGSGSGGFGGGQGGTGGLGGAGIGKGFGDGDGRGRANVSVPASGPEASAGLTRQEILAVIQANLNQIRHCYEQLLQRSPNASGKVAVNFQIGATGDVTTVSIKESTISDSIMRGCVTGRIQRWQFPKPRGTSSVDVSYPFVFTPL